MEMDSTYDTKGSGDNLNQGDTLVEGYFWHDRTRSNYQDYPYYNQKGIKKRIRHIAGGIQALLRPFKKDMEERYLVLKNEKLPGREDRVKIIYIYEVNKTTKKPMREKGPIKGATYKLENLYLNVKDRKCLSGNNSNTVSREFTLYFRGEKVQSHRELHKLDLWFRDDDAAKRNKWADLIQQYRLEIKAEIDAEVERGHSDTLRPNVPYYMITHDDRRSSNAEITYVAPEINFHDFEVTQYCACSERTYLADCLCMDKEFKAHIQERIRNYTKQLDKDQVYHLLIEERKGISKHPDFQILANEALKFTLELVRVNGTKSGFSIAQTDYSNSGPYDGIHYLFGFLLNSDMFEKGFPKPQVEKMWKANNYRRRYEIVFKLHSYVMESFQTKLFNLSQVNKNNADKAEQKTSSRIRTRTNTAPGGGQSKPPRPTMNKDSIELNEMGSVTGRHSHRSHHRDSNPNVQSRRERTISQGEPTTTSAMAYPRHDQSTIEEEDVEGGLYENQNHRPSKPVQSLASSQVPTDLSEAIWRKQDEEQDKRSND